MVPPLNTPQTPSFPSAQIKNLRGRDITGEKKDDKLKKKKIIIIISIVVGVIIFNAVCFFGYRALKNHQKEVYKNGIQNNVKEFILNDEYFKSMYGDPVTIEFPDDAKYEEIKGTFKIIVGSVVKTDENGKYDVTVNVTSDGSSFQYEYASVDNAQ